MLVFNRPPCLSFTVSIQREPRNCLFKNIILKVISYQRLQFPMNWFTYSKWLLFEGCYHDISIIWIIVNIQYIIYFYQVNRFVLWHRCPSVYWKGIFVSGTLFSISKECSVSGFNLSFNTPSVLIISTTYLRDGILGWITWNFVLCSFSLRKESDRWEPRRKRSLSGLTWR